MVVEKLVKVLVVNVQDSILNLESWTLTTKNFNVVAVVE